MAPCHQPQPTRPPNPVLLQHAPVRRQDSSPVFTHPDTTGPVFPTTDGSGNNVASSSTGYAPLFPSPTSEPTGVSLTGTGTSGLPSDVFVWIFILVASGLVLITALYRIWRLRQLNRSMSTFFRTGNSVHPSTLGPMPMPPTDPRHPDHATYFRQSAYPPLGYLSAPPRAYTQGYTGHSRVQGADVGVGGRRLDSGMEGKEELPAYERGTLPGYGDVVGYSSPPPLHPYSGTGSGRVDRDGWEIVEMDRLGSPTYAPGAANDHVPTMASGAPPPAVPERPSVQEAQVQPQLTGTSNNPFRTSA